MKKHTLLALVLLSSLHATARSQVINTFPAWDGTTNAAPLGEPSLATIGQVFTVDPNFTHLDTLAFGIANIGNAPVNFGVVLTLWDPVGLHAAGPALFFSGELTLPTSVSAITPLILSPNVQLLGNTTYVAFFTESPFFDGIPDSAKLAFIGSDVYAGGGAVAIDNGSNLAQLESATWLTTPSDLAFAATFSSPVPEPATYGLAAAGVMLALVGWKRRAQASANMA